jgi:hypothetical protein
MQRNIAIQTLIVYVLAFSIIMDSFRSHPRKNAILYFIAIYDVIV